MQRDKKFKEIEKEYDEFYRDLLKQGKLPVRDTEIGIWGVSLSKNVYDLFKKINLSKYKTFLDLGSGDGKVVLIASLFGINAVGIEYDEELYKKSVEIKNKLKLKCKFIKGNFLKHDFSNYDIIFINPDQGFHKGLEDKLLKELKGKLFVYNFVFEPRFLKKGKKYWFDQNPVTVYDHKS
jgi:glutamyl-tRNA reductase